MTSPTKRLNVTVMNVENFCNETKRKRSNMTSGRVGTIIEFRLISPHRSKLFLCNRETAKISFSSLGARRRGKVFNNRLSASSSSSAVLLLSVAFFGAAWSTFRNRENYIKVANRAISLSCDDDDEWRSERKTID